MSVLTRRSFLKTTGLGIALASVGLGSQVDIMEAQGPVLMFTLFL